LGSGLTNRYALADAARWAMATVATALEFLTESTSVDPLHALDILRLHQAELRRRLVVRPRAAGGTSAPVHHQSPRWGSDGL